MVIDDDLESKLSSKTDSLIKKTLFITKQFIR